MSDEARILLLRHLVAWRNVAMSGRGTPMELTAATREALGMSEGEFPEDALDRALAAASTSDADRLRDGTPTAGVKNN